MHSLAIDTHSLVEEWPADLDPSVGRAVKIIQERFAEDLDLATVAREAGVSRSVLRDRFVELLGDPPMRYRAKWRMRTAAHMLREGKENTANIAYAVGFNSEAAFNRAFKREFGRPPASWKRKSNEELAFDRRPSHLSISGAPTGVSWITRNIADFLETHRDLSVQLEPNPRTVKFDTEDIDCSIYCGTSPSADLEVEELFRLDFAPMCSPKFLTAHPDLKRPADLLNVPRITPTDPWWLIYWRHYGLEPIEAPPGVEMRAQLLDGLAAMSGQGIAMLTPLFWTEELSDGRLVRPLPQVMNGTEVNSLVYPRARAHWPKIRRLSEWLHSLCGRGA
jgi:AraC-like DNA-binding protein